MPLPVEDPQEPDTRPLNELSLEQLRVMLRGYEGDWRNDTEQSKGVPPPPAAKTVATDARRIDLVSPEEFESGATSVRDAIASRRSVRQFSSVSLSLEELSCLLWSTQGITGLQRDEAGDVVHRFRAAPSGGGRYPLETYLVVNRVDGVAAGLYRYLVDDHQLLVIREAANIAGELQTACYGAPFVGDAAVTFVWAAVPQRSEWKYGYLAARMIAMEAGHVCQNLYLAAGAAGAGCCALLAYDQPSVDRLLGVDGRDEFTIYLACVGRPATEAKN